MKKTYIVCCRNVGGNTVFVCKNCGRHISHYQLAGITHCQRCERKFKRFIKIDDVNLVANGR